MVDQLTPAQVDDLLALFRHTYWASERDREGVERMLAGSDHLFGVLDGQGRLRAFARVLTDGVYRGVVFDVVVDPGFRGQGLARMLFQAILGHPVLSRVENLVLYCKEDVVQLYQRFGFSQECEGMRLMRRVRDPDP